MMGRGWGMAKDGAAQARLWAPCLGRGMRIPDTCIYNMRRLAELALWQQSAFAHPRGGGHAARRP